MHFVDIAVALISVIHFTFARAIRDRNVGWNQSFLKNPKDQSERAGYFENSPISIGLA
jgi:hypothetical protein